MDRTLKIEISNKRKVIDLQWSGYRQLGSGLGFWEERESYKEPMAKKHPWQEENTFNRRHFDTTSC